MNDCLITFKIAQGLKVGDKIYNRSFKDYTATVSGPVESQNLPHKFVWKIPVTGVETSHSKNGQYYIKGNMAGCWTLVKPSYYS